MITRGSEDNIRIEKHASPWDDATWDSSKLKCRDSLRFLKKKVPYLFAYNSVLFE
jgi:hypothetical protein